MYSLTSAEAPASSESTREPKYYRLKQHLEELTFALPVGSPVPTERALATQFTTSRTTVRQAVQALVAEGRLERFQGRGTFVARPKVSRSIDLSAYPEDRPAQGLEPASRLLELGVVPGDAEVARRLETPVGSGVYRVRRLLTASGEPMAVETAHLVSARFPGLREHVPCYASLPALLRGVYGVRIVSSQETIETVLATPVVTSLLSIDVGMPLLLLSRHSFGAAGEPVMWVRSVYRGDRYKFVTQLPHPAGG